MTHDSRQNSQQGLHPLIRGAIIGGSIGLLAVWFGYDMGRAFFLGVICGGLAAYTAQHIREKRRGK